MKSIKLSDYFKVIHSEYIYLKLISNFSIRNANTQKLAKAVASLYKGLPQSIKREDERIVKFLGRDFLIGTRYSMTMPGKIAYFIYIERQKAEFYLIIPTQHYTIFKEKISDVWPTVTIEKVDILPQFGTPTKYQMVFRKEDPLSLRVDRRDNDLLNSTLNIIEVMEDDDRAGVFYNFMPTNQNTWFPIYRDTIQKVKSSRPVDRNKMGLGYILSWTFSLLAGTIGEAGSAISGEQSRSSAERDANLIEAALSRSNRESRISEGTYKKGHSTILNAQIIVLSESKDRLRQINHVRSLARSFDAITEDNSLMERAYTKPFDPLKFNLTGVEVNKVSTEECQNFIALPGRELLEKYRFINRTETQEIPIPEELRTGIMCIGECTYRGTSQLAYLSDDPEYKYLTLVVIGPTRAGKSTLIGNLSKDAINAGECVVMFDFVKGCELSQEVAELFPASQVLNIECSNPATLQGLGYNEVRPSKDAFVQYCNAKLKATQLMTLINSINSEASILSPKMERFLSSAALIAFISNGSIRDVFRVLTDHIVRHEFIKKVQPEQYNNLEEYAESLLDLDESDDKTGQIVGTKTNLIIGVIDRLQKLKANPFMEQMLKRGTEGNIDLVDEMQKSQLICIKMPETMFATDGERDIYTVYWLSKLWLALQIRAQEVPDRRKHIKANLIIDELYQVDNSMKWLTEKLSRLAKFSLKPILSCHYLNQIKPIREELRSANTSFLLISGCDSKNFHELSSELYPFTEEDLLRLPRYHSLNLVKSKDGYARFITHLPRPI
ncbi:MAG: type IV secretory system conjugative DNA transfer family protein [Bacillota bacterium]